MQWCDFYDAFWDWSDSTRRTRISSLENIGPGDEVVEAVLEMEEPKLKAQLIRKAIKLGVKFSSDNVMNLDGELPDDLYATLANAGHVKKQVQEALDNLITDEQIKQLEKDVDILCKYLDENNQKPAKGCLQSMIEYSLFCFVFMVVLIVCILLLVASGN